MSEVKASGYISQLTFNNGKTLDIRKNDIVIFVGPNNAGKSQSLKDIYALAKDKVPTIVISDIRTEKQQGSVLAALESITPSEAIGQVKRFHLNNELVDYGAYMENSFSRWPALGELRPAFVANLDTAARLSICQPPKSVSRHDPQKKPHPFCRFRWEIPPLVI